MSGDTSILTILGVGTVGVGLCYLIARSQNQESITTNKASNISASSSTATSKLQLTARVANSKPILIKEIAREVAAAISLGNNIINLSQGVPCLKIFEEAAHGMQAVLDTRMLPYSDVPGHPHVRQAAAQFVNTMYFGKGSGSSNLQHGSPHLFSAENVLITAGGIQACFNTLGLVLEGEDDVVLSSLPAYSLYQSQATYFGATFDTIMTTREQGFKMTVGALEVAFARQQQQGKQVRLVVVCSPNNPTGACMTVLEARAIAEFLEKKLQEQYMKGGKGFLVLLDEVYLGIESVPHVSLMQVVGGDKSLPLLEQHLCLVLSCSKGLGAMPGVRAAWVTSHSTALIQEMVKIQSNASANASTLSQAGLQAALEHIMSGYQHADDSKQSTLSPLEEVNRYYSTRTTAMVTGLNRLGRKYGLGKLCEQPQGTFYVWADFNPLKERSVEIAKQHQEAGEQYTVVDTDLKLRRLLLNMHRYELEEEAEGGEAQGLAVIPGAAFSMQSADMLIRINCAKDDVRDIDKALNVIDRAIARILKVGGYPATSAL